MTMEIILMMGSLMTWPALTMEGLVIVLRLRMTKKQCDIEFDHTPNDN